MKLLLHRDILNPGWTLSTLQIDYGDGRGPLAFGYAVEDTDRGLDQSNPETISSKIKDRTAIPVGTYVVKTTWSPKYHRHMPEVQGVPGYRGIRIHSGNDHGDTSGCILPGLHRGVNTGTVTDSRKACDWLYTEIARLEAAGDSIELVITH